MSIKYDLIHHSSVKENTVTPVWISVPSTLFYEWQQDFLIKSIFGNELLNSCRITPFTLNIQYLWLETSLKILQSEIARALKDLAIWNKFGGLLIPFQLKYNFLEKESGPLNKI